MSKINVVRNDLEVGSATFKSLNPGDGFKDSRNSEHFSIKISESHYAAYCLDIHGEYSVHLFRLEYLDKKVYPVKLTITLEDF